MGAKVGELIENAIQEERQEVNGQGDRGESHEVKEALSQ